MKSIKVPFYEIWDYIKQGGIDGQYDEKKNKYAYETVDYGPLYLNSLPTLISNKFTAQVKRQDYGRALIFNIEKLERFEDLYSNSQLKEDNVKIEVKLVTATKHDDNVDYADSVDFPDAYTNFSEKKTDDNSNNQGEKVDFDEGIEAEIAETREILKQKNNEIDRGTLQKSTESTESTESSLISNQDEDEI